MSYDFRHASAVAVYKTTAGTLARILAGCKAADLLPTGMPYTPNDPLRYPGTNIPIRRVPENAPVTFVLRRAGGHVEDQAGGWIAERFGALGLREARACAAQLEREGVTAEI